MRLAKILKSIGLPAAMIIAAGLIMPQLAGAVSYGGIGGRVANPDPKNPRSQSIFIYNLDHGQTKKDQLLVMNNTDETKTIKLGSVDGVVTNDGAYTCRQEAEPVSDSGGWVKLDKKSVTLKAGEKQEIDFTVTVPDKADVGEHNSCLTMQADEKPDSSSSGVRLHMRQAIRMAITIPGDLHRDISIKSFQASRLDDGGQHYEMTVDNKGNVSADVAMQVKLYTLFGGIVDEVGGEYPVIPDQSLSKNFDSNYRPLFGGWYKAESSARYSKKLGAYGTSSKDAEYETKSGPTATVFIMPKTAGLAIIIGVLLVLVGGLYFGLRMLFRNKSMKSSLKSYTVREGDTLQGLATKANVSWKDIARINKLRAPYNIEAGSVLKIPTHRLKKSQQK